MKATESAIKVAITLIIDQGASGASFQTSWIKLGGQSCRTAVRGLSKHMDNKKDQKGQLSAYSKRDMLRLQLTAQLAAQCKGSITGLEQVRALRPRVSREPVGLKSVLVVDDEPSVRELVAVSLEAREYKVLPAASVAEARAILQSHTDISLVITDLKMPVEDGFVLLEFLRNNLRFHHIPAVVFTSCSDLRFVRRAVELGAQAYLAKPFTAEALVDRVTGVLESSAIVVVLVSDSSACRTILGRDMTLAGYTVHTAESGQYALDLITKGRRIYSSVNWYWTI